MEFIGRQINVAFTKNAETAVNTPYTVASAFRTIQMEASDPISPNLSQHDNGTLTGANNEGPTSVRANYWDPNRLTVGEDANSGLCAMFLFQALGGTQSDAVPSGAPATAKDHLCAMQTDAQGVQVPTRTAALKVGGIDYLFSTMGVSEFSLSLDNAENPVKWAAQMVSTGYHKKLSDLTPAFAFPPYVDQEYLHSAAVEVTFTPQGGTEINLTTEGLLIGFNFSINNNIRTPHRRPGDKMLTPGDVTTGAYQNRLVRQARAVALSLVLAQDETDRTHQWMRTRKRLENFKIKIVGPIIETGFVHELELTFPAVVVGELGHGKDGETITQTVPLKVLWNNGTCMSARVRNANAVGPIA